MVSYDFSSLLSIHEDLQVIKGCDIPDVEIVVQWKAPANLLSWVQRAGHAAWGPGRMEIAVMLVERSTFEITPGACSEAAITSGQSTRARGTRGGRGR